MVFKGQIRYKRLVKVANVSFLQTFSLFYSDIISGTEDKHRDRLAKREKTFSEICQTDCPYVQMYRQQKKHEWIKTPRKKEYKESCPKSRKSTNKSDDAALVHRRCGSCWAQRRHHNVASPWRAEFEKITNNRPIKAPHHSLYQHPPLLQAQNEERREGLWKKKGKAVAPERCWRYFCRCCPWRYHTLCRLSGYNYQRTRL